MNITLRDLLRWPENPLRPARLQPTQSSVPSAGSGQALSPQSSPEVALLHPDHEVSWPVTMRATPPMLPHVDAGALVLLPATTLAEVRGGLPEALRELRRRGVAALVVDRDAVVDAGDLDVLRSPEPVNAELEATLARLVSARRTRLYRRGTELDRALTEATLHGRGVARLLAIGAEQGERDLLLLDERGRVGEVAGPAGQGDESPGGTGRQVGELPRPPALPRVGDASTAPISDPARGVEWLLCPVGGDIGGWVAVSGPLGALDEGDRLLIQRVAAACALGLARREGAVAPSRLSPLRRAALTADLLRSDLSSVERAARADTLGLEPAAAYGVLLLGLADPASGAERGDRALHAARRSLTPLLGRIARHAGAEPFDDEASGATGLLLHAPDPDALRRAGVALRGALGREPAGAAPVVAALSEAIEDLDQAPAAARQARFALALLRDEALAGPLVDWSSPDDLGAYTLLYHLWGTPEATRFVESVLGELPAYDARYGGELLPTLAAYLEHGGAAGAAATLLAVHRNTLTYRLRRIAELTGRSPLDPTQQLSLRLAVMLHRLPPADEWA